jgi:hypothetical protein
VDKDNATRGIARPAAFLQEGGTEKDRQPQNNKNELDMECLIVVTDVCFLSI